MTRAWEPCGGYSTLPSDHYHSLRCQAAAAEGKVPAWTAEDEANLRRRVQRLAAKAKP